MRGGSLNSNIADRNTKMTVQSSTLNLTECTSPTFQPCLARESLNKQCVIEIPTKQPSPLRVKVAPSPPSSFVGPGASTEAELLSAVTVKLFGSAVAELAPVEFRSAGL